MEKTSCDIDIYYMKEALKQAQQAYFEDEVPIGAIIVCNNKIIAKAHNLSERLIDATAHAEMQAFTAASAYIGGKYLKGCTLYVTVEPCPMCAAASYWTQIDKIVYGVKDEKNGFLRFGENLLHPKTELVGNIYAEECKKLMSDFFKDKRK